MTDVDRNSLFIEILNNIIINGEKYNSFYDTLPTINYVEDFRSINIEIINNYENLICLRGLKERLFNNNLFTMASLQWHICIKELNSEIFPTYVLTFIKNMSQELGYRVVEKHKMYNKRDKYNNMKTRGFSIVKKENMIVASNMAEMRYEKWERKQNARFERLLSLDSDSDSDFDCFIF